MPTKSKVQIKNAKFKVQKKKKNIPRGDWKQEQAGTHNDRTRSAGKTETKTTDIDDQMRNK